MSQREQLFLLWAAIWFAVYYFASKKFRQSLDADRWDEVEQKDKQWNI